MKRRNEGWILASEASERLGVSRATLYAYVSRGQVRSQPLAGSARQRTYALEDVERLRRRAAEHRAPGEAAAHALQWGLPVLESAITLVDGRRLFYRGHDATVLARTQTLEAVAGLIWTGRLDTPVAFIPAAGPRVPPRGGPFVARAQQGLATAATQDPAALDLRPSTIVRTGARIVRLLAGTAAGTAPSRTPGRLSSASDSIDVLLSQAWAAGSGAREVLRAALVLCADHELNVSSFTARCVASAGSDPYAVVSAALSALGGPRHGGASARVAAMLASLRRARSMRAALDARLRRGEPIEGFGHPLYPAGDPRATLLLGLLEERYARSAELRFVTACREAMSDIHGEAPNLDFGLAATSRVLGLPPESPLMLFAVGRSVGWIGHALEQYATGQLIRPRARYVGVPPHDAPPP